MIDETVPKLVQYLPGILVLIAGGILFGWSGNRDRLTNRSGTSLDGWLGDDGPHHHGSGAIHGGDASGGHDGA